jgi:hypothetical protein
MRKLTAYFHMIEDENFTQAKADAVIAEDVAEMVSVLGYSEADARGILLANIGYFAGYYPDSVADAAYELFRTEHPIFGRTHPTAEEAFKAGQLAATRSPQRRIIGDKDRNS